jgi:hypothetical protein
MLKRGKLQLLILLFVITCGAKIFAATDPPPPTSSDSPHPVPCSSENEGSGGGVSPPPGLCLPINDYLVPLFIAGVVFGSIKVYGLKKKQI